jgi:hypothetical protein
MKFKKLSIFCACLFPVFLIAQKEIKVTEIEKEMSMGVKPAYVVSIPQAKLKDVNSDWKKYIKKDAKGKVEEDKGETRLIGAVNKNVSPFPFNILSKVLESSDGVQLSVWASDGDLFISTNASPDKSVAIQKYIRDFAVASYKDAVKEELKNEQDKLKETQKVLDGFVKDQKKAEDNIADDKKEIEKLQNDIKKMESEIEKAKGNQTKQKLVVDSQSAVVKTVSDKMNGIK